MKRKFRLSILACLAVITGAIAHSKYQAYAAPTPPKIVRTGKASWYSKRSPGINKRTANNEIFDDEAMTCAMWGVPFNQKIKITNRKNGKSIIVRVNDRGPHQRFVRTGRVLDLTKEAFEQIAPTKKGLADVELEFL
jgi:rare lipoprotein A